MGAGGGWWPPVGAPPSAGWPPRWAGADKHLITRFRQQVGLQPKLAARLVRLDRVWRRLDQGGGLDWGLVAVEAGGPADQAHLVRDFGHFTGMTPTQFQARLRSGQEVKSVQDPVAASA